MKPHNWRMVLQKTKGPIRVQISPAIPISMSGVYYKNNPTKNRVASTLPATRTW